MTAAVAPPVPCLLNQGLPRTYRPHVRTHFSCFDTKSRVTLGNTPPLICNRLMALSKEQLCSSSNNPCILRATINFNDYNLKLSLPHAFLIYIDKWENKLPGFDNFKPTKNQTADNSKKKNLCSRRQNNVQYVKLTNEESPCLINIAGGTNGGSLLRSTWKQSTWNGNRPAACNSQLYKLTFQ